MWWILGIWVLLGLITSGLMLGYDYKINQEIKDPRNPMYKLFIYSMCICTGAVGLILVVKFMSRPFVCEHKFNFKFW